MPLIEISVVEGRPADQIRALIHEVHAAVVRALEGDPARIRVLVRELPASHWAAGDVTIAERTSSVAETPATSAEKD